MADLLYNGTSLKANSPGLAPIKAYRALSGEIGSQSADKQKDKDKGPLPEGNYHISLEIAPASTNIIHHKSEYTCSFIPDSLKKDGKTIIMGRVQANPTSIPTNLGIDLKLCEEYMKFWGPNRVYLHPQSQPMHGRSGFYIHDSNAKETWGCIEVKDDERFFEDWRKFISLNPQRKYLILEVKYPTATAKTTWLPVPNPDLPNTKHRK